MVRFAHRLISTVRGLRTSRPAKGCYAVLASALMLAGCHSAPLKWPTMLTGGSAQGNHVQQLSMARLSERHGQLEFASQVYRAILRNTPDNQEAHHRLGVIAARQGRFEEAQSHFSQAQLRGAITSELLADAGYTLYLQQRLDEAESTLREALHRDPHNKTAHNNLGLVLAEQGRHDESLAEFREAVDEGAAYANLAYVCSQIGDLERAEANYHRALAVDNELRPAAEALVQVAERRRRTNFDTAYPPTMPMRRPTAVASRPPEQRPTSDPNQLVAQQPTQPQPTERAVEPTHAMRGDVRPVNYTEAAPTRATPTSKPVSPPRGHAVGHNHYPPSVGGVPLRLHAGPAPSHQMDPVTQIKAPAASNASPTRLGGSLPQARAIAASGNAPTTPRASSPKHGSNYFYE